MRIDIITVLPEMLEGFVHESILARAEKKGLAEMTTRWTNGGVWTTTPMEVARAW